MIDQTASHSWTLIGQTVSHYRVVEKLGSGGMGVVYKAEDTRLDRIVAIKFLPEETAFDHEALKRFHREARAASALNHPNICTVHDIGEHEGQPFIVMECMEGQTLKQLLDGGQGSTSSSETPSGALPTNQVLELAIQIADALNAAHAKGIVHRDIKPTNIFLTHQGQIKILDFGLAKVTTGRQQAGPSEDSRDLQTGSGIVAGTVQYMSPEQTLGQRLDGRSDLFSFGAVLYEMATGRRAFPGSTISETIAHILYSQPEGLAQFDNHVPLELKAVIRKCLEKQPGDRYPSAEDLRTDLQSLKRDAESGQPWSSSTGRAAAVLAAGRKRWKVLVPAALVLIAAAVGGRLYFRSGHAATRLTDKDTIVLSDFINKTGDAVFDDTLKQGLSVQLEQSPFLALLSDSKLIETLKLMGRTAEDRLTPEVTHEVCQRTGSKAMLTGSIIGLGSQYVIGLKAVSCDTGDVLAEAQEQAAGKEMVLKALGNAAVSLRGELGESLSSVQKYATPLEEATTPSLEALKVYSLGVKTRRAKGRADSLPFFIRAVELDPNFAMAYTRMADAYGALGEAERFTECARKAYALREKVSERERFYIEGNYYYFATGEEEKARRTYELWKQTYPRDALPYDRLGLMCSGENAQKAIELFREALRLEPDNAHYYGHLSCAYQARNRLDEAEALWRQAEERGLGIGGSYYLAFLKGNAAKMAQLVSAAMGTADESGMLEMQANTEAWYGKLKIAHELTGRAMEADRRNGFIALAALHLLHAAMREVEAGNLEQARADAQAAMNLAPQNWWAETALVLARAGDTARAEKLAAKIEKSSPLDPRNRWLLATRAAVAMERQDPKRAIEILKAATPVELGDLLIPEYMRGQAYLMLRDGKGAGAEFQKFVDQWGKVGNFPWGALARLGLARAYAIEAGVGAGLVPAQGRPQGAPLHSEALAKARAAYQDFLTIWKDADPDLPVFKQAKAEYAKLR